MSIHDAESETTSTLAAWVASLAAAVACCAILFVLFASRVNDLREQVASANVKLEDAAARQDMLLSEIRRLRPPAPPTVSPPPPPPLSVSPAAPQALGNGQTPASPALIAPPVPGAAADSVPVPPSSPGIALPLTVPSSIAAPPQSMTPPPPPPANTAMPPIAVPVLPPTPPAKP